MYFSIYREFKPEFIEFKILLRFTINLLSKLDLHWKVNYGRKHIFSFVTEFFISGNLQSFCLKKTTFSPETSYIML